MSRPEAGRTPNFILGAGAQKAGTTWLFDYLDAHPQCAMGPIKEMRYFSDPDIARQSGRLTTSKHVVARNRVVRLLQKDKLKPAQEARLANELDALLARYRPSHYPEIYRAMVARNPNARLIGDISPEYGSLHVDDMQAMADCLEGMGYPVKVVFLLRDPVGRAFSMARMKERGRAKLKDAAGVGFREFAASRACERLTRYETIIPNLERVFGPDQIFYGLYEDFFRESEIRRLCDFLEITFHEPKLEQRSNDGGRSAPLAPEAAAQVRALYAETYDFCRNRFGAERIDRLWGV